MNKLYVLILGFLVGACLQTGCVRVRAYQTKQTLRCEQTHTAEQCRVLYTPACQPSNNGGQNGCHN